MSLAIRTLKFSANNRERAMLKKSLCMLFIVFVSACSSSKKNGTESDVQSTPIINQKLATNFKRQGVKLEWECSWGTGFSALTCVKGKISAIEVTAYAPSFGNSEANRETAFSVAHDAALVKLNRFIQDEVTSDRVIVTMSKNVEKANDKIKSNIRSGGVITLTDEEAQQEVNSSDRTNSNEVVRTVTESIRTQSSGILRGVRSVEERVVDRQTVAVTIRWDKDNEQAVRELRKRIR